MIIVGVITNPTSPHPPLLNSLSFIKSFLLSKAHFVKMEVEDFQNLTK